MSSLDERVFVTVAALTISWLVIVKDDDNGCERIFLLVFVEDNNDDEFDCILSRVSFFIVLVSGRERLESRSEDDSTDVREEISLLNSLTFQWK